MNKLLKDAIADAKAVRETALANAKLALEEAFLPKMQSMLSSKIREEMEEEEPEAAPMEDEAMSNRMKELAGMSEEGDEEMSSDEEDMGGDDMGGEEDMEDMGGEEDYSDEGDEEDYEEEPSEDDADFEEILRELEDEESSESTDDAEYGKPEHEMDTMEEEFDLDEIINSLREEEGSEEESEEPVDEEIDLNELLASLNEEEGEEEEEETESKMEGKNKMKMKKMEEDLNEAYSAVKYLRSKLSEVNLLNAKLLYVNKLFRNNLTETQKVKVIENFDRAKTVREAKLVYATLAESLKAAKASTTKTTTKKSVMEGFASKATKKTNSVLTEGNDQINRFKKLAGII